MQSKGDTEREVLTLSQVLGGLKYMVRQLGKTNGSVRILGELKSSVLLMMESVISSFLHEA
ncbi:predicted protein [Botrytis cinerea T4]|uniref:Uncharacterized protein n=1 Tax=Botryotinia fuckeliana (strain T4) TaxID=999810 RepID=G2Y8W5_BOTF4|nr:predicted protein [Botrytis cinerea T4]